MAVGAEHRHGEEVVLGENAGGIATYASTGASYGYRLL